MSGIKRLSQIVFILRVHRSCHIQIRLYPLSLLVVFRISLDIPSISHLIHLLGPPFCRLLIFIRSSVPYWHIPSLCAIELRVLIWNARGSWHVVILPESSTVGAQMIGRLVEIFAKFRGNLLFSIICDRILHRRTFKFFWLIFDSLSQTLIKETQPVNVVFVRRRNPLTVIFVRIYSLIIHIITSWSLPVLLLFLYRFSWR